MLLRYPPRRAVGVTLLCFAPLQDQLLYMRGLIIKHVQKPMTRDQVRFLLL